MRKNLLAMLMSMTVLSLTAVPVYAQETTENVPEAVEVENTEETEENIDEESSEIDVVEETVEETVGETAEAIVNGAYTGWDDTGIYYYVDGEMLSNTVYEIDGAKYAFNDEGEVIIDEEYYLYIADLGECHYVRADEDGKLIRGWYYDDYLDVYFYYYQDTCFGTESEIATIDGLQYYFDYDGWLICNETLFIDDVLYQADEDGVLTVVADENTEDGWLTIDGDTYYYENGAILAGVMKEIDGYTYYFGYDGAMVQGDSFDYWVAETDTYVLMLADEDGHVLFKNGWYQDSYGDWYYFKDTGLLAYEEFLTIGGCDYYFEYWGRMQTGSFECWDEEAHEWIWMMADENGAVLYRKGWYQDEYNDWYYFKDTGILASGELMNIGGSYYYFYGSGNMATGAFEYYDSATDQYVEAFADASGAIINKDGWVQISGYWYYLENGKAVVESMKTIGGTTYYFNDDGQMLTGNFLCYDRVDDAWKYYFAYDSGAIHKNGWVTDGLYWYYAKADSSLYVEEWLNDEYYFNYEGEMVVGEYWDDDGHKYLFDSNGKLIDSLGTKPGWQKYEGFWYYYNQDLTPYDGWLNDTYYIAEGRMLYADYVWNNETDTYSYLKYDGTKVTGWYDLGYGDWVYADSDGNLAVDTWVESNGTWYYFDWILMVQSTIIEIDGQYCIFDHNGVWKGYLTSGRNEWVKYDGGWYYYDENGELLKDCSADINGVTYYFDYEGRMYADTYIWWAGVYVNASGQEETISAGWHMFEDSWFYYESAGNPASGLTVVDGVTYYFYSDGEMYVGMKYINGEYVLFNNSGAMQKLNRNGWYSVEKYGRTRWYYVENGTLLRGVHKVGGTLYCFDEYDGEMAIGTYGRFVFNESGTLARNAWVKSYGAWYYADANGRYLTGEHTINGTTYWFDDIDGMWIK